MPANIYSMAPARLGSVVLPADQFGFPLGIIAQLNQHSGQEYPTLVVVPGADRRYTCRIPFFDAFSVMGLTCVQLSTFDFYLAKYASLVKSPGAVHPKFSLNTSCVAYAHITGASVSQDGLLMAEVEIIPLTAGDGTVDPIVMTTSNSLPALTAQPTLHTLGPYSLNGTVIPGLMSAGMDLNQQTVTQRSDGDQYARVAARFGGQPKLMGKHADPIALITALGQNGVTVSSVVQYYRGFTAGGLVSNAAGSALSVTVTSGRVHPTAIEAEQGKVSNIGMELLGLSASSTHPFAISTTATPPAVP